MPNKLTYGYSLAPAADHYEPNNEQLEAPHTQLQDMIAERDVLLEQISALEAAMPSEMADVALAYAAMKTDYEALKIKAAADLEAAIIWQEDWKKEMILRCALTEELAALEQTRQDDLETHRQEIEHLRARANEYTIEEEKDIILTNTTQPEPPPKGIGWGNRPAYTFHDLYPPNPIPVPAPTEDQIAYVIEQTKAAKNMTPCPKCDCGPGTQVPCADCETR